jgi:MraZ protein
MSSEISQLLSGSGGAQAPFMGRHVHRLDPKKRLTIPSGWRNLMGQTGIFLMPGIERSCLMLMPEAVMSQFVQKLQGMQLSNPEEMELMLTLASESDHLTFDAQGRIRVKDEHLGYAGLTGEVVLASAFNRIELWNPENWEARSSSSTGLASAAKALKL